MKGNGKQPAIRRFGKRLGERNGRKKLSPHHRPELKRLVQFITPANGGPNLSSSDTGK
jgi:hypothetical protein